MQERQGGLRNVVTITHLDPDLHEWLKEEARRRSEREGRRIRLWHLINAAVQDYKAKCDPASAEPVAAGEVSHAD